MLQIMSHYTEAFRNTISPSDRSFLSTFSKEVIGWSDALNQA